MSIDEFHFPADPGNEPLVGEPIVDSRFVHHSFEEGRITICDEENPEAWITADESAVIEFGGGR